MRVNLIADSWIIYNFLFMFFVINFSLLQIPSFSFVRLFTQGRSCIAIDTVFIVPYIKVCASKTRPQL